MDINFEELQDEKEFFQKILKMDNEEDILKEFEKHGKKISHEELMNLKKLVNKVVKKLDTLSDDQLDEICGGGEKIDKVKHAVAGWLFKGAEKLDPGVCKSASQTQGHIGILNQIFGYIFDIGVDIVTGRKVSSMNSQTASYKLKEEKANKMAVAAGTVAVVSIMFALVRYRKDLMKWWCSGE